MNRGRWVALLAISLVACSFGMKGPPPGHLQMTSFECSESTAAPVADVVGGAFVTGILFVATGFSGFMGSPSGVLTTATAVSLVLFAASAMTGFDRASRCQSAKRALAARLAVSNTVAAAMAPSAGAAVTAGQPAKPEPAARPATADTVSVARAPSAAVTVTVGQPAADTGLRRAFTIEISGTKDTLAVGERLQLLASARSPSGDPLANLSYQWTSSNPATATVGLAGRVSAIGPGLVTITAHIGAVTKSVSMVVVAR